MNDRLPVRLGAASLALLALLPLRAVSAQESVPTLASPAVAPEQKTVALHELWRAGGESEEILFGVISQALADRAGNTYLLDSQLNEVHVFGPGGEFLRTLAGEGDGPGELRGAGDMFFLPAERLALLQSFPGKAVFVGLDGTPAGGFSFGSSDPSQGSFGVLVAGRGQGEHLALAGIRMSFDPQGLSNQEYFLSRMDEKGAEGVRYYTKTNQINYANFVATEEGFDFLWSGRWDMAADGRLYGAPDREAYRIEVRAPDGTLERILTRECLPYSRNGEEKASARRLVEALSRNYPAPVREIAIFDTEPAIIGMHCRPGGGLWVRTTQGDKGRAAGVLTLFDVFGPSGRLERQLAVQAPGDPAEDAIFLVNANRLIVVTQALSSFQAMQGLAAEGGTEETAPMEVICYELPVE